LRLAHGRLTLRCPHPASGFTVATPSGEVTDLGTEFGVSAADPLTDPSPSTNVVTFEGTVRLTCGRNNLPIGTELTSKGQGFTMTSDAIVRVDKVESFGKFVRVSDFDKRRTALEAAIAIIKNPDLLAYSFFDPQFNKLADSQGLMRGLEWRTVEGLPQAFTTGNGIALGNPVGPALTLDGRHVILVDFDTSVTGRLAQQGYLGPDRFIEADDKTIYLSWLGTAEKFDALKYGGVSLADGDKEVANEYVFLGKPSFSVPFFASYAWKSGRIPISAGTGLIPLTKAVDGQPIPADSNTHLWVIKIEFCPGNDRMSVFLDPGPTEPGRPNVLLNTIDFRFDRLRFTCGKNNRWSFARLLLGSTYRSVTPEVPAELQAQNR
jgi:hypothetical protein